MTIILLTFFLPSFLILFFSFIANKLFLLDKPNNRKIHSNNIPLVGGIAIYLSLIIISLFINLDKQIYNIILISGLIVIMGVVDDIKNLGFKIRLFSQIVASLILVGGGIQIVVWFNIDFIDNEIFQIKSLALLLTILCVVGLTNAFNFIDGIDGFASGSALIAFATIQTFIFINLSLQNNVEFLLLHIFLIVFIFFIFNVFLKNKVFLGDAGSNFLGFFIGFLLIYYSHYSVNKIHPLQTVWCVAIPCFDFFAVFLNRILKKKSPFLADNSHIHHLLYYYYDNQKKALFSLLFLSIAISFVGVISTVLFGNKISFLIYIFILFVYLYLYNYMYKKINNK